MTAGAKVRHFAEVTKLFYTLFSVGSTFSLIFATEINRTDKENEHFKMAEQSFSYPIGLTKRERYERFLKDFILFIEGEDDQISALANTCAALHEAFGFFWVGFYLVHDEEWLHLGPFQGSVACTRIKRGRGVCGTAWAEARTLIVRDVDAFPGHIACSSLSRSEIVVPLKHDGRVIGVLDIDSDQLNDFDVEDQKGLEAVVICLVNALHSPPKGKSFI